MKAYYNVDGSHAVEATPAYVLSLFEHMQHSSSYVGVQLDDRWVLQFRPAPAKRKKIYVEQLDTETKRIRYIEVAPKKAEELIVSIVCAPSPVASLKKKSSKWKSQKLK